MSLGPLRLALARIGTRWRLAAAAVCLLLAAVSALEDGATTAPARQAVAVVVAAHDLAAGHRLRSSDLRVSHDVRGVPGTLAASGPLRGRVLAGPLPRGEPVVPARLLDGGLTRGLSYDTAAVPIDVTTDVRGVVRPGGRVDLLAVPAPDVALPDLAPRGSGQTAPAERLAERVLVLAVLPADPGTSGCRLVLALGRDQAVRITGARSVRLFQVVALPP